MATVPKIPLPVHEVENVLAFDQERTIKANETVVLGTLDTSRFDKVRLVAANEESTCNVHFRLNIMEPERIGKLEWFEPFDLDQFTLKPYNQLTKVFDVPATKLEVVITGVGKPGTTATVEVLIYGQY
jgi:hypothetical protein